MEQIPPPLPPQPPPIPVAPLNYQSPMPRGRLAPGQRSLAQRAARFSWMAPVAALVVGVCTMSARNTDSSVGMVLGALNGLLILSGFVAGIAALFGIRRQGISGILVPAIFGIVANGFLILMMGVFIFSVRASVARHAAAAAAAPAAPLLTPQQVTDSIEKYPGWVGAIQTAGTQVVAVSISADSPLGANTRVLLPSNYLMLKLTFANSQNDHAVVVDLSDAAINCADGTVRHPLDTAAIFRSSPDPHTAASAATVCPTHMTVNAGKSTNGETTLFLPDDIDLQSITSVTIKLDGQTLEIPGRFLSVAEKQENLRRSKAAAP